MLIVFDSLMFRKEKAFSKLCLLEMYRIPRRCLTIRHLCISVFTEICYSVKNGIAGVVNFQAPTIHQPENLSGQSSVVGHTPTGKKNSDQAQRGSLSITKVMYPAQAGNVGLYTRSFFLEPCMHCLPMLDFLHHMKLHS